MGAVVGAIFMAITSLVVCSGNHKKKRCPVDTLCKFTLRTCYGSWIITGVLACIGAVVGWFLLII